MLQTEILGKYNSSLQWSKLPNLQMHRILGFFWKTYAQPAIGVIGIPRGPRGCAQRKALESQLFFSALTYIRENISCSRTKKAQPFGKFTPSKPPENSLRYTVTGSAWKGYLRFQVYWREAILILKVYMKGWEKDPKGRIKEQNAEKISWFFIYSCSLKKEKERDRAFKAV